MTVVTTLLLNSWLLKKTITHGNKSKGKLLIKQRGKRCFSTSCNGLNGYWNIYIANDKSGAQQGCGCSNGIWKG
jgi:hypothetical protein